MDQQVVDEANKRVEVEGHSPLSKALTSGLSLPEKVSQEEFEAQAAKKREEERSIIKRRMDAIKKRREAVAALKQRMKEAKKAEGKASSDDPAALSFGINPKPMPTELYSPEEETKYQKDVMYLGQLGPDGHGPPGYGWPENPQMDWDQIAFCCWSGWGKGTFFMIDRAICEPTHNAYARFLEWKYSEVKARIVLNGYFYEVKANTSERKFNKDLPIIWPINVPDDISLPRKPKIPEGFDWKRYMILMAQPGLRSLSSENYMPADEMDYSIEGTTKEIFHSLGVLISDPIGFLWDNFTLDETVGKYIYNMKEYSKGLLAAKEEVKKRGGIML